MKILILLVGAFYIASAQVVRLSGRRNQYIANDNTFATSFSKHFSDKFSCFYDVAGVYEDFHMAFYGQTSGCNAEDGVTCADHYCCGYMANGLKQCDIFDNWSIVNDNHFALCDNDYATAFRDHDISDTTRPKLRRDVCCENSQFNDCTLCKSFMVWDFTVTSDHGGDDTLENARVDGEVSFDNDWRTEFNKRSNQQRTFSYNGYTGSYPPYAYTNQVFPAGYARAKLREFNDPPICVYAPNTAGRVIEVKVEPDETGNNICVDDLHEDSLERNNPGVTQACDTRRLRTCFPDASMESTEVDGFGFLISCSESCADGDVDLWFRVRSSVQKWTEAGLEGQGTDRTEINTEMWCMWGVQDMRSKDSYGNYQFDLKDTMGLEDSQVDGNFARWDVWPSDLAPEVEPRVTVRESGSTVLSFVFAVIMLAFAF